MSRTRRRRRLPTFVIRRGDRGPIDQSASVNHPQASARGMVFVQWRVFSAVLTVLLCLLLGVLLFADGFTVNAITVSGNSYLTNAEIYSLAGIEGSHVLAISTEQIRQQVLRSQSIANAHVQVGWSPNLVQVTVVEREPAIRLQVGDFHSWVDIQGFVLSERIVRDDLLVVTTIADPSVQRENGRTIDSDIVHGALQLQNLVPTLQTLQYDAVNGLGYRDDTYGWGVWFGVGANMPTKMQIYQTLIEAIEVRGIQPTAVYIVNPDAPYYQTT